MSRTAQILVLLFIFTVYYFYENLTPEISGYDPVSVFSAEELTPELSIYGEQYLKLLLDRQYIQMSNLLEPHLRPSNDGQDLEIVHALNSLGRKEEWLGVYFDEWVKASPKKAVPYLARANYLMELGLDARGTDYIRNTPKYKLAEMRRLFSLSLTDLNKVKAMNNKTAYPYAIELKLAMRQGTETLKKETYAQGVKRDPVLNWVRTAYFATLAPKWGGSIDEEQEFITELISEYPIYPSLKSIEASWMVKNVNAMSPDVCDKVVDYQRVYDFYTDSWTSYNLGRALSCNSQYEKALKLLKESVELWPYRAIAWRLIGAIQHRLGKPEEAIVSTRISTHLDPTDDFAFYQLGSIAMYLEEYQLGVDSYKKAVKANPNNSDYPRYVDLAKQSIVDPYTPYILFLINDSVGSLVSETTYIKGRREGQSIIYDKKNRPKERHIFENDSLKQVVKVHRNGYKLTELTIKDGKYSGPFKEFSQTGKIILNGRFDKGNLSGEMMLYFENGDPILSNYYEEGKKLMPTNFLIPENSLDGIRGISIASKGISHIKSPLNHVSSFEFNSGRPIFVYTALDGIKGVENELLVEFFDSKNKQVLNSQTDLENSDGFNFNYVYYYPDLKNDNPGKWTIKIYLNGQLFDSFAIDVNGERET